MKNVAIVAAPYHPPVEDMISVVTAEIEKVDDFFLRLTRRVSGSFEIPLHVKMLLQDDAIDAIITLGAIEKGETLHGQTIGHAIFDALISLSLEFNKPVTLGIIGPGATSDQIKARAIGVARSAVSALFFDEKSY